MDLSVVVVVATVAAGIAILVAVAAVFAARRSTAHADLALKEASRISRASISRINEVQSEASSARLAARHAAERLRSMTKERTTPDSVAAYRVFLREVVEDSKHLLGPEGTGTMKNDALDRLRVGALVGGSDEVLRALRNFALLRTERPEAPWPSAYAMAYARLESDLVTAIRNDLGSSEESLTADQIWGAVNARCVDPAFRLALLSPLEEVLRNAGQDPTHYDLDHIVKPADYPGPFNPLGPTDPADSTGPIAPVGSASPTAPPHTADVAAGTAAEEPRQRSRRAQDRVVHEASAAALETAAPPAAETTTVSPATGPALPDSSEVVWAPLSPGRRGVHAAAPAGSAPAHPRSPAAPPTAPSHEPTAEPAAPTAPQDSRPADVEPSHAASAAVAGVVRADAPGDSFPGSSADAWAQAVASQQTLPQATPHTGPAQPHPGGPMNHRAQETQRPVFEDPTPSRISRRRRAQGLQADPSVQAATAVPSAAVSATTAAAVPASTVSATGPAPTASTASSTTSAVSTASTASAGTEETEPVFAPIFSENLTRNRAAEPAVPTAPAVSGAPNAPSTPASLDPSGASWAAEPAQPVSGRPVPAQPRHNRTRANPPTTPPTASAVRATAVAARTVTVPAGPQPSPQSAAAPSAPASSAPVAGATGGDGYGIIPPQGAAQAPSQAHQTYQAHGQAGGPVPDHFGQPGLPAPRQAEQSSAVAAAGAVPASAVGAHRAVAVPARTAAPAGPAQAANPDAQETITVPTGRSASTASATTVPTASSWSFTPPSLQDSAELPRARGA